MVLVVRVGPYVEVDCEEMIQHHIDQRCCDNPWRWTRRAQALELFVVSAPSARATPRRCSKPPANGARDVGDISRSRDTSIACRMRLSSTSGDDGLLERNAIRPVGKEAQARRLGRRAGAQIHRNARIVAPAYIGAHAKVRASALITRGSVVEQHAEVDCGTVVENSTVLPYTYMGAGLDVMHSVVGLSALISHAAQRGSGDSATANWSECRH